MAIFIYLLFFSDYLAVNEISVSGIENVQQDDIKNEIKSYLSGRFLDIVEKNNLIFIRSSFYEEDLARKFKKIDTVDVRRKFPNTLLVSIKERKLAAIFSAGDRYFVLDDKGEAFEEINHNLPEYTNSSLAIIKDSGNSTINPGDVILSQNYIFFLENAKKKIESELSINLNREFITPNRISGDFRAVTQENWSIYFNASLDAEKEVGMLKAVLDEKIPSNQRNNLEYIDLRSDNKVFYKFKEGSQEEITSEEDKKTEEQPKVEEKKKKKK
ncbi:MAG TPA: FtsQ-type POTRA domain-containing protein [Patescibacteria group bacterium]|nr:FtsQ-type POTRA domain-containing protein [Patescibacteria group bacterium]